MDDDKPRAKKPRRPTRAGIQLDAFAEKYPARYRALREDLGYDQSALWRWRKEGGQPPASVAAEIAKRTGIPVRAWGEFPDLPSIEIEIVAEPELEPEMSANA